MASDVCLDCRNMLNVVYSLPDRPTQGQLPMYLLFGIQGVDRSILTADELAQGDAGAVIVSLI